MPKNATYAVTLCEVGRLAPYADLDAESCEFIYSALEPFAGIMNFTGASISDANDVALGCLADHLGRHAIADDHYRDAIVLADRARAIPFATHYRYEWARALVDRGDIDRARPLLVEVADIAHGHDMDGPAGYVSWSAELLTASPESSAAPHTVGSGTAQDRRAVFSVYSASSGATSSMNAALAAAGLNSTIRQPVSVKTRSWPDGM